jgi:hypothetical protein
VQVGSVIFISGFDRIAKLGKQLPRRSADRMGATIKEMEAKGAGDRVYFCLRSSAFCFENVCAIAERPGLQSV